MSPLRQAVLGFTGVGVYGMAMYMTYQYTRFQKDGTTLETGKSYVADPCRTQQFQKIADQYDNVIGTDEFLMGINLLRRWLLYFHAKGTVLEVGAGTARNVPYYPSSVDRVVLSDASDQMLAQARDKIGAIDKPRFAVLHADASQLPLPEDAFDTVVDTFGLCSFDDPVAVLKEMSRVCKPDGKILLLEHGRSHSWSFVTNQSDRYAEQHAAHWGCVWNRDLDRILKESGLEVQVLQRWHFGTTYYVVLAPSR